jgi:hypothetical protein
VLLLLGGEKSHNANAACPLTVRSSCTYKLNSSLNLKKE